MVEDWGGRIEEMLLTPPCCFGFMRPFGTAVRFHLELTGAFRSRAKGTPMTSITRFLAASAAIGVFEHHGPSRERSEASARRRRVARTFRGAVGDPA